MTNSCTINILFKRYLKNIYIVNEDTLWYFKYLHKMLLTLEIILQASYAATDFYAQRMTKAKLKVLRISERVIV